MNHNDGKRHNNIINCINHRQKQHMDIYGLIKPK